MWIILQFFIWICVSNTSGDVSSKQPTMPYSIVHSIPINIRSFDNEIDQNDFFILFYSPECEITQKYLPKYDRLADTFNSKDTIKFGHINCRVQYDLCNAKSIEGLQIYLYRRGEEPIKYKGVRTDDGIIQFLIKHMGEEVLVNTIEAPDKIEVANELTDDTFNDHISDGKHFVKFYAPWCGHCQRLAPTWALLGDALEYENDVSISKIDCTQYRPICLDFEVKGYPTLLWIEDGKKIEKYSGPRTIEGLKEYVEKMSGSSAKQSKDSTKIEQQKEKSHDGDSVGVLQLSTENFAHAIEKGVTFVKFVAPWCGHCKRMAPTWDELGVKFIGQHGIKIAKVDCTIADNKELCAEQEVDGFPTIYLYNNGEKVAEYNGSRSLEDLYEFVIQHTTYKHEEL